MCHRRSALQNPVSYDGHAVGVGIGELVGEERVEEIFGLALEEQSREKRVDVEMGASRFVQGYEDVPCAVFTECSEEILWTK